MAEYFIQQKALSSNARTLVQDNSGKNLFLLVGRWGRRNDSVTLYDLSGNLLGKIKQTSVLSGRRFVLFKKNIKVATMRKLPTFKEEWYFVSRLNWLAQGNFSEHRYVIKHGQTLIMEMLGAHIFKGGFYSLVIPDDENAPLAILIAAVLDYWLYSSKPKKNLIIRPRPAWV